MNAYAASAFLQKAINVTSAQFTALDRPHHINKMPYNNVMLSDNPLGPLTCLAIVAASTELDPGSICFSRFEEIWGFDGDFFADNLQDIRPQGPLLDLRIDNYFTRDINLFVGGAGVGDRANGEIYNHLEPRGLVEPNQVGGLLFEEDFNNNHSGVQQWYRWTIGPNSDIFTEQNSSELFCDNNFNSPWDIPNTLLWGNSLNPCASGWYWALNGPYPDAFPYHLVGSRIEVQRENLSLGHIENHGCELDQLPVVTLITCIEHSSPFVVAAAEIPQDADFLSFEYRFPSTGEKDYAAVFIDNIPVWTTESVDAFGNEFIGSGSIPIRGLTGQHQLTVALYGVGQPNAEFQIRNLRVASIPNRTPIPDAGPDQILEATSPSNTSATLSGSASSDPDEDSMSFAWSGPFGSASGVSPTVELPLGVHTAILTATDPSGLNASDTVVVAVQDTTPPVLNMPPAITSVATSAGGSLVNYSVITTDVADPNPTIACIPASGSTFPIGSTTVSCTATDAAGNSSTGTTAVTVQVGQPKLAAVVAAKGIHSAGVQYIELRFTNTGTGHARNLRLNPLTLRTLSGSGTVTYNTALSPALPRTVGNLDVGGSTMVRVYLNVPATVTRFSITESGTIQNVTGTSFSYSMGQTLVP